MVNSGSMINCYIAVTVVTLFIQTMLVPFMYWAGKRILPMGRRSVVVYGIIGITVSLAVLVIEEIFRFGVVFWQEFEGRLAHLYNPKPIHLVPWSIFIFSIAFVFYAWRRYPYYKVWVKEYQSREKKKR